MAKVGHPVLLRRTGRLFLPTAEGGGSQARILVGTSALVHPAASLPLLAMENEIPTVEVNPSSTPITTRVTYALTGPAGEILPALVEALKKLDGEINDHPHHI